MIIQAAVVVSVVWSIRDQFPEGLLEQGRVVGLAGYLRLAFECVANQRIALTGYFHPLRYRMSRFVGRISTGAQ